MTKRGRRGSGRNGQLLGIVAVLIVAGALGLGFLSSRISPAQPVNTRSDPVLVSYNLGGTAKSVTLSYTDGAGNTQMQAGVKMPAASISVSVAHGATVSITATNEGDSGDLKCTIDVATETMTTGYSTGAHSTVTCTTTVG